MLPWLIKSFYIQVLTPDKVSQFISFVEVATTIEHNEGKLDSQWPQKKPFPKYAEKASLLKKQCHKF